MQAVVRIGAVSYLNAVPLVFGLAQGLRDRRFELSWGTPAFLAERMRDGALDLALLPVIELGRIPDLEVVPGLGIVTRGAASSVRLIARRPIAEVESVACDPESRTSNALTQLLFAEAWGRAPRFAPGPPDLDQALAGHDAAVRIGDKALFERVPDGATCHDLAEAWTVHTGLPFVFAVWAARPGVVDRPLYELLHRSRRAGLQAVDQIADEHRWNGAAHPEVARRYLRESIRYRLGADEARAIEGFLAGAARLGLIERAPRLRFALAALTTCGSLADARRGA